jgi:AcrR family transcriptional regulator
LARPPDPERRSRTLAKAADYVLAHGLEGLSLRPLAAALGTSPRMLLYDFESKEALIDAVLAEIRRREERLIAEERIDFRGDPAEALAAVWRWVSADERAPFMRLFFETYVDALRRPEAHREGARPLVRDWVDFLGRDEVGIDETTATLMIAIVRGLLLDRLAAADPERTDRALTRFAELVDA